MSALKHKSASPWYVPAQISGSIKTYDSVLLLIMSGPSDPEQVALGLDSLVAE